MLYWLKSGQVNSRQAVAELGRNQATITRWLKKYKDGDALLEVKHAPGQAPLVTGEAHGSNSAYKTLKDFIAMVKFNNGLPPN